MSGVVLMDPAGFVLGGGHVAGGASSATANSTRLFRFSDGVGWEILGGVGEYTFGINNEGTVVGQACPPPDP